MNSLIAHQLLSVPAKTMELKGKTDDLKFQWKSSLNNLLSERKKHIYNLPVSPSWHIIPNIVFKQTAYRYYYVELN